MSLLKTLTKVAIGIAVAKGVQTITTSRSTTTTRTSTSTRKTGTGKPYRSPDDLEGIMDEILGSGRKTSSARKTTTRKSTTGLDDLFSTTRTSSRSRKTTPKGGLEDLLGGKSGGGLGDLLGGMLGGTTSARDAFEAGQKRSLGDEEEAELEAALMLRCMIHAVKADGQLDAAEKARLMEAVGEASRAEINFINEELSSAPDLDNLLNDIPRGLEEKAYCVSLMAIDLDQRAEAEYLHQLATGLGLEPAEVNALHERLGAPTIYG
ncbi:tellurite resistance TerB family protein [Thioclava sp. FR2]|uniref:tellurite resistance TerB family protein n=1 Tax=Thioclava sp. FR2 TaxID=3445780 RepID=UPI003EC12E60